MTDRKLMQQALDALEGYARNCRCEGGGAPCDAAEALRARLAQPDLITPADVKQLARIEKLVEDVDPYTAPPQREYTAWNIKYNREPLPSDNPHEVVAVAKREWQGMTDEDIRKLSDDCAGVRDETEFIRAIEAKLKEKNNAI